jgi:hypothetical protein
MMRWIGALAAAAIISLAGMAGAACGDGGERLTLEEYFQLLDELDDAFSTTSAEIDREIGASEDLDEIRGLMGDTVTAFDDFIDGLEDLDAPDEVREPHDEAAAGLKAFRDELRAGVDETASATTVDEAFAAFDDLDYSGSEQAQVACRELEQIAADNGITVDFYCGGEDDGSVDGGEATPPDGGDAETPEDVTTEPDGTDGGDTAALEAYFQRVDAAENAYRAVADETDEALAALDDTTVDQAADILRNVTDAIDAFVAELEAIDPPDEVGVAHQETVAGFRTVSQVIGDALDDVEAATTMAEVAALFNTPELSSLSRSLDGTCNALQDIAAANGITVDLGCE